MEQSEEISNLNSIVIQAFSSSQDYLDILSNFSKDQSSPTLFVDALFCDDSNICCEKTKYISMKILTLNYENELSMDLIERLENFYIINFSSDHYNNPLISSSFSIDLFASIFKYFPLKSIQLLNDFYSLGDDRYPIVISYTIEIVKKLQKTDGFENILMNIFQKLPEMASIFNEMISIRSIFKLFLPTIISQKTHIYLFQYYETNEDVCNVLRTFLQLNYLFDNTEEFDIFCIDYINIFNEIITNDLQIAWKTELLLDLRKTISFRKLSFDSFYVDFIQKIYKIFEYSYEFFNDSIEITTNFLSFFGIIDQLNCNSVSEEALVFNKTVMDNCRSLIIANLPQIKYDDNEDFNSPIFNYYEKCSILFLDDYINGIGNLINSHLFQSFSIIKEMVLSHKNKSTTSYIKFIETDKLCLISFLELEDKPVNFYIDFLNTFIKIYPPTSNYFHEEYFHSLIVLIEILQNTKEIDLLVLRKAVDCINEIPILDENQLQFLIENPLFQFIGNESNRKEMKRFFRKISKLSFIDKIAGTILSIPELEPEIIFDYFKEIPLDFLFIEFIPIMKERFIPITNPIIIIKFIYSIIKKVKSAFFPYMSVQIITVIKLLCEMLNEISVNNPDNFYIQKKILKSITVVLNITSINIGVFLFYGDDFFFDLISKNISFLCGIDLELICKDLKFIFDYFNAFQKELDFSPEYLNDDSVFLFIKIALYQVQQDSFDFDLLNKLFSIVLILFENGRVLNPIEGLTDSLLDECLKKGSKYRIPYSMYFTISYLFKIHPNLLSDIVQNIMSSQLSESYNVSEVIETIINGSKDQIVIASQTFFGLFMSES